MSDVQQNDSKNVVNFQVSDSLDYSKKALSSSSYRMKRVIAYGDGTSPTLSLNNSTNIFFKVPEDVLNLSKSYISFDLSIPASGAGTASNNLWGHKPPIQRIYIENTDNQKILDVQNFEYAWLGTVPPTTPLEKFLSQQTGNPKTTVALARAATPLVYNCPTDSLVAIAGGQDGKFSTTYPNHAAADSTTAVLPYSQSKAIIATNADTLRYISCKVRLGDIAHTIAGLDLSLFFRKGFQLHVEFANMSGVGFFNDGGLDNLDSNPANWGAAPTMSNLALYYAQESNPNVIQTVRNKVLSSGMKLVVPVVNVRKKALGAAGDYTVENEYSIAHGDRLLRIYSFVMNSSRSLNTGFNTSNYIDNGGSYRTLLNETQLQDQVLSTEDGSAWSHNAHYFAGSQITRSAIYRSYTPTHIDSWVGTKLIDWKKTDTMISGLDLSTGAPLKHTYEVTTGRDNGMLITVAVLQKEMTFDKDGVWIR
jgi:hypothetical protein